MDELGFNKIAAAILATALGYMGIKELAHAVIHVEAPKAPAYALAIPEAAGAVEEVELPFPQADWIAAMDANRGARVFKKCTSCHNAEKGGANGTGPNLWNVVGAPAAQHAGFNYSTAFQNSGKTWNYQSLYNYLERPTKYIPGTSMNFIGLKKAEDRAAVIEYLRLASDNPLPKPDPAPGPEDLVEAAPMDESTVINETPAVEAPLSTEAPTETPEMEKPAMETQEQ